MPVLRRIALVPVAALLLIGAPPVSQGAERALPETVVVKDSRSSAPIVDISQVTLDASWYWDSEQSVYVKVPNGFRPGHRLTIWFDIDGDPTPEGHYELKLRKPGKPGGKWLRKDQEFRLGGGWGHSGALVRCSGSDGGPPSVGQIKPGERSVGILLDLWWCLKTPNPAGDDSGAWRVAVSVAKGKKEDMAPNRRGWSRPAAGWGPCDPSGGAC